MAVIKSVTIGAIKIALIIQVPITQKLIFKFLASSLKKEVLPRIKLSYQIDSKEEYEELNFNEDQIVIQPKGY